MAVTIIILTLIFIGIFQLLKTDTPTYQSQVKSIGKRSSGKMQRSSEKLDEKNAVYIGTSYRKPVFIPHNTAHVLACGTTGGGKTVALANFIKSGIENKFPLLLVDGKGDIGKGSIFDTVLQLKGDKKLYVINLNDPEHSDRYNPFCNTTPSIIKDMLINMSVWTEEHYKANAERYLQKVIDLMRLDEQKLSFKSIVSNMVLSKFQELCSNVEQKKIISKEEYLALLELGEESGKTAQSSVARFSTIIDSELGKIFHEDGIDIYTALQENAIILFILNPLMFPVLSPLFGNLVIIDAKKAIAKIYGHDLGRIFYIFDEINVYASKNFLDLVNKSRSANITCILATQSLSDLDAATTEGEYFKEQIIENCNNYIIMRQNSATNAEQWAQVIGTQETMSYTFQLDDEGATGKGTAKKVREFICHPDEIKMLCTGEAFYVSKDSNRKHRCKVSINKPI